MTLYNCPEPGCTMPAASEGRPHLLESTNGPVEHVRLRCVVGHYFHMPTEGLTRA